MLEFRAVLTVWLCFRLAGLQFIALPIFPPAHLVRALDLTYCAIVETTVNLKIGMVVIQKLTDSCCFLNISGSASHKSTFTTPTVHFWLSPSITQCPLSKIQRWYVGFQSNPLINESHRHFQLHHHDIHDNSQFNTFEACGREYTLGISVSTQQQPNILAT